MVRVDLELVYYYIWVDSGHVLVGPSKAVVMLLEKLNECKAEVGSKTCANLDLVIQKVWVDADIIQLIYARLIGICVFNQRL